jgi:hypothetical protein
MIVRVLLISLSLLAGILSKDIKKSLVILLSLLVLSLAFDINGALYFSLSFIIGAAISHKLLRPKFKLSKDFFKRENLRDLVQLFLLLLSAVVYWFFGIKVFYFLTIVAIIVLYLGYLLDLKLVLFLSREIPDMGALYLAVGSLLLASFFSPLEFILLSVFYKGGDALASIFRSFKKHRDIFIPALILLAIGYLVVLLSRNYYLLLSVILATLAEAQPIFDDNVMIPIAIVIGYYLSKILFAI